MHPDTSKLKHSTCMQADIYKDNARTHTRTHTLKTFYSHQPSSKQRNLNTHSYRQTPLEMYRLQNGGGGLSLGWGGDLGRGKSAWIEHTITHCPALSSLPGLIGVCLLCSFPCGAPPQLQTKSLAELVGMGFDPSFPLGHSCPPPPTFKI